MHLNLKDDLYSIDNERLVRANEKITKEVLGRVTRKSKEIRYITLKDTVVFKDIKEAFKDERYPTILSPKKDNEEILTIVKGACLPEKVIAELTNIKKELPYTYRHIIIVTILSTKVALDNHIRTQFDSGKIAVSSLPHDIGKARVPKNILHKTTPLTFKEYKILRSHPLIGYILLHYYYGKVHDIYDYASYEHHERLDGSGYPRKIKKINIYSQLIAAVDMFDALLSPRPYRKTPFTLRGTLDLLVDEVKLGRLNQTIVYLLISYARKDKPGLKDMKISQKKRDLPPKWNAYGKIARK